MALGSNKKYAFRLLTMMFEHFHTQYSFTNKNVTSLWFKKSILAKSNIILSYNDNNLIVSEFYILVPAKTRLVPKMLNAKNRCSV